jgi:cytochrome c553
MKNINEAQEHLRRENNIPVITRMASNTIVKKIQTVFGPELFVMEKKCTFCGIELPVNNFYVKKGMQNSDCTDLDEKQFRSKCIPCHDLESKENAKARRRMKAKEAEKLARTLQELDTDELRQAIKLAKEQIAFLEMSKKPLNLFDLDLFDNG